MSCAFAFCVCARCATNRALYNDDVWDDFSPLKKRKSLSCETNERKKAKDRAKMQNLTSITTQL